ncbi:MAG TPA: hypothetical protein VFL87_00970 [Thermoleophilaceae bacterium]|nr:hypothetical protein [Thermoleophilaceae bacterium]
MSEGRGLSEQAGEESVSGELGERVRAIVAAAESMAAAVRSDADAYAEQRRREADAEAERRIREATERAEELVSARLAQVRELSEDVARTLRAAAERASREFGGGAGAAPARSEPGEGAQPDPGRRADAAPAFDDEEHPMAEQVRPLRPPGDAAPRPLRNIAAAHVPRPEADTHLDDARLVALQMAVAGRSRDEVEAHLRTAFDVPDPQPILDHVFAEGFPPSAR